MSQKMEFDLRIIGWIMVILIIFAYLVPLGIPITIGKNTIAFAQAMKNVSSGGTVVLSNDCGVNALYNLGGGMAVVGKYFAERGDVKIIIWGMSADTFIVYQQVFKPIFEQTKLKYGEDYVLIGYIPGGESAVAKLADDIPGIVKADYFGTPISNIPLMKNIINAKSINLVFTWDTGDTRDYYVAHWFQRYGTKICIGVVALNAIDLETKLAAGQIVGGTADIRGGAELELNFHYLGTSIHGTDILSITHIYVLVLLVLGNIVFFIQKRSAKSSLKKTTGGI